MKSPLRIFADISRDILRIGWPIILSSTGFMLMQVIDGIFLSRFSAQAVAAIGPAGMACWMTSAFFMGAITYVNTLVAHSCGAGLKKQMATVTWQAVYLAALFALVLAALSPLLLQMFALFGHEPGLRQQEETYYGLMLIVICMSFFSAAFSGFFIGQGITKPIMQIQIGGQIINAVFGYAMILGHWGFPAMGVAGAAYSSILGAAFSLVAVAMLYFQRKYRDEFNTWKSRKLHVRHLRILTVYGGQVGLRHVCEALVWTVFMLFIGRLGTTDTAATSIAFRLNFIVLFPLFGLCEAVRTLVGHSKGAGDNRGVEQTAYVGVGLISIIMGIGVVCYLAFGSQLYDIFAPTAAAELEAFAAVKEVGIVLLRFVAAYCLADGLNLIMITVLLGCGDTRWAMYATFISHGLFLICFGFVAYFYPNLYVEWTMVTALVFFLAFLWLYRFQTGKWREIQIYSKDVKV